MSIRGRFSDWYNYDGGYKGYAAHTIGHKEITISNNNVDTGDNNNDINANVDAVGSRNVGDSSNLSGSGFNTGEIIRNSIEPIGSISEIDEALSETESDDNSRTLIVVSIRGSVMSIRGRFSDW